MIFPYILFYYSTINNFKSEKQSPKNVIQRYIQHVQEPLDLDSLIAKEELKLKFNDRIDKDYEDHSYNKRPNGNKKRRSR